MKPAGINSYRTIQRTHFMMDWHFRSRVVPMMSATLSTIRPTIFRFSKTTTMDFSFVVPTSVLPIFMHLQEGPP